MSKGYFDHNAEHSENAKKRGSGGDSKKWKNNKIMVKKCSCGGAIYKYGAVGFLPEVKKCNKCGNSF